MRFTLSTLIPLALSVLGPLAAAQQNAFNIPPSGFSLSAGQSVPLTWQPTTQGTISLVLRSGDAQNLAEGSLIASDIQNSGSYTWNIPSSITKGSVYTIQIVSSEGDVNYTPYFPIDSSNTTPSSTSNVPTGAPSQAGAVPTVPASLAKQQSSITAAAASATSMMASGSGSAMAMASATGTATATGTDSADAASTSNAAVGGMGRGRGRGAAGALVVALAGAAVVL